MRDIDIRNAFRKELSRIFAQNPSVMVDELPVCLGDARIDIAVVNGKLHGYEIKSDFDTLDRLPRQAEMYSKVFDTITLVCSVKWVGKAEAQIPSWWGIIVPISDNCCPEGIRFEERRNASDNCQVNVRSLVELLWKDEALEILSQRGLDKGIRSKPRWDIWDRIVLSMEHEDIKESVRACLKAREGWRADDSLQRLCAD